MVFEQRREETVVRHNRHWTRRVARRRFLGLLGAGAAAFAAACGGGGEEKAKSTAAPAGGAGSPAAGQATAPARQLSAVKVGGFIDRSGATANVGNSLGDGAKDWVELANAQNLVGRRVEWIEYDHSYEVPKAEQGYKKFIDQDKVVAIQSYGTPITNALAPKAADDRVPLFTPGYGISEVENGAKYPYAFVGVASYHSQAMALLGHFKETWKDTSRKAKVIYMYYDNAAGQDPLELIKAQAPKLGLDLLTTIAVPPAATDLSQNLLEVKNRDPDFLLTHFFGTHPALSIKAAAQVGFPVNRMYSMVWGIGEPDIEVAGAAAEGYHGLQFVAVKEDNPQALQMLREYWQKTGKTVDEKKIGVYYLRGVYTAALILEAIRLAGDKDKLTGEDVKKGTESIKDFTAYGLSPGTTITPQDHAGSRKVRLYQVKNGKLTLERDWFEGPKPS
jgi:branched-chain amino acid transport system substrate-binding protein